MRTRFQVYKQTLVCSYLCLTVFLLAQGGAQVGAAEEPKVIAKSADAKNSDEAVANKKDADKKDANGAGNVFGLTKVWTVDLEMSAQEFAALQPAAGGFGFPGGPPPRQDGKQIAGKRDSEKNLFGTEFPWAECTFTSEGQTLHRVGIRFSGDITYFASASGLKRPLKLAFDKFTKQQFNGLSNVQFHAMPLDPAKAREALGYSVFRTAGLTAPRTAFAAITLSVPGKHDKAFLGLYTVVENVDQQFCVDRFGTDKGLLMKPFRMRGIDFHGADWERYSGLYHPQREPTPQESQRVIDFAKLINQAPDDEFNQRIGSFLDVDAFLRDMAAHAVTSNLESFFALGHNYFLYLDPKSNQFRFIPGDLEFSFANFLLLGTAEELMDLSLLKPYPGENKLPQRLLAMEDVKAKYMQVVEELSAQVFTQQQLIKEADLIATATAEIRKQEANAVSARQETTPGIGGPAGAGPGGKGPQPPDIKTFARVRSLSITNQLAGKSMGYVPRPLSFGPPPGGGRPNGMGANQPIDEKSFRDSVQVPPQFEATLFAAPPKVSYPVAIAAAPAGDIYVAVDEQGSLGRTAGGGKILHCSDRDGDGKADEATVFAKVEHPRGVTYRNGSVWVMHPPTLSVFHDDNGDHVADRQDVLVTGLTTDQITIRGGDHTTNCVRMGIDGWLYIGVGDYGIKAAKGKDGRVIVLRGGGIVRVRPDGTELEIYCSGLRNPFDIAIDPYLNLYARDNTNDGAGWDTRVSLLRQTALYGYTQLFAHFTDEIMPTLGTFGGGGGTGALVVQDTRWPEKYRNTLLTGDWGRSEVYRHELRKNGATFDLGQELFLKLPRATGMDLDASGHLYVASWRGGEAAVNVGPNVGFIARITPRDVKSEPFPDLKQATTDELLQLLSAPQAVTRLHAQGEILGRDRSVETTRQLVGLASDADVILEARAAAIFTLQQLDGKDSYDALLKFTETPEVREFALRALTDRISQLDGLSPQRFVESLSDESPRVRAQALISLGRLGDPSVARSVLPLTSRPRGSRMPVEQPVQNQPDPDRVVPHLAVRTLVALNAIDACLDALDGPHWEGALWAMRYMHDLKTVEGLIKKLSTVRSRELRRGILVTLIRLYHREADYQGSWWGIRPDSSGPYYERTRWALSDRIGAVVTAAVLDSDPEMASFLHAELGRHHVKLAGLPDTPEKPKTELENPIVVQKVDPANPEQLGNMAYLSAVQRTLAIAGDPKHGEALFKAQSCVACHTTADGQTPKGPHLVDIGKRYKPEELVESILKPSEKLAQGFESYQFVLTDGRKVLGFIVSERADATIIREANGVQRELKRDEIELRQPQKQSAMPEGLVASLKPGQLADLLAYLQSLK